MQTTLTVLQRSKISMNKILRGWSPEILSDFSQDFEGLILGRGLAGIGSGWDGVLLGLGLTGMGSC